MLAVAIVAATVCAAIAVLSLAAVLTARQRTLAAADAAALAAADVVLGVVPGDPCGWAGEVAAAHRVALIGCVVEGAEVVVTVRTEAGGVPVEARSRAGPPR